MNEDTQKFLDLMIRTLLDIYRRDYHITAKISKLSENPYNIKVDIKSINLKQVNTEEVKSKFLNDYELLPIPDDEKKEYKDTILESIKTITKLISEKNMAGVNLSNHELEIPEIEYNFVVTPRDIYNIMSEEFNDNPSQFMTTLRKTFPNSIFIEEDDNLSKLKTKILNFIRKKNEQSNGRIFRGYRKNPRYSLGGPNEPRGF